ncbi:TonB-dependent receptor plug domain-containing protein [Noviherbaspirillum saxi]|uniref:TonB-dependent receptor n=1 Tax=Noviherbaspirillum saxi TaxID=2320863 RepID=A0A3A3FQR9_9BURK|nr:TonB-dependent receptor [Noviherbaspirillum saxi]RJF97820.1 TonB-dependent receptor [Noviherbaspirillum saxi]
MQNRFASFRPGFHRRRIAILCACLAALSGGEAVHAADLGIDLPALPIERLLTLEVYSASKFSQKITEAPSAVSVVTAADIKAYGWRTLADILRSMRGLYLNYDRNYDYLGARGFLRPGDYNTRFLLLVDGNRINDGVYDQAPIGTEFIVDVDLIERVEFVPGPGSSIYGANAFFGVINVLTKRGSDLPGSRVAVEGGSHGERKLRASYGMRNAEGLDLLISATSYRERGADLYYPEFDNPPGSGGIATHRDHDRADRVFLKGAIGPLTMSIAHAERTKGVPTASFSQVFNDPRSHTVDVQSMVNVGYRTRLDSDSELSSHLYWGRYDYDGDYLYDLPPVLINRDGSRSRWWGGETKLITTRFAGHKTVAGAEYRRDYRRGQFNFDVDPFVFNLDDRRAGSRSGVYVQDEMTLSKDLLLNAGMRYDWSDSHGGTFNPRLALIRKLTPATTVKALYGKAFREPNAFEMYYAMAGAGGQRANPDLKAERIRTLELAAEHQLAADTRVIASAFRNTVSNLISQAVDPTDGLLIYGNLSRATAHGVEAELERAWARGARMRASYSWQRTNDSATGAKLPNTPRHLAKLNLSAPVYRSWRAGLEAQYVARRNSLQGYAEAFWLANLTLSSVRIAPGLELSASIYNLFDRQYVDPGAAEHVQDLIRQNGRTMRIRLSYAF